MHDDRPHTSCLARGRGQCLAPPPSADRWAIATGSGTPADRPLAGKSVRWSIPFETPRAGRPGDRGDRQGGDSVAPLGAIWAGAPTWPLDGKCGSRALGGGRRAGPGARTRKQRRPRSRRTLAELSKCRGPANARDACREASDEQAPEQGTPSRFGERSSEPAARSALASRGSAPTTTSGGEYYRPVSGVAAIARESAEGPVRAGANPVSQPSRVCARGKAQRTAGLHAAGGLRSAGACGIPGASRWRSSSVARCDGGACLRSKRDEIV
jgi:hypothetical protein